LARQRSPEFIAIPMVAVAVVYGGLLYWALTADTAVAWTIFAIANVAIVVLALVLVLRRRPPELPLTPAGPLGDGVCRLLVIVDGAPPAAALGAHVAKAAAGRPAKALVLTPTRSSRLDWVTGDQAAYDDASTGLDATVAALEAAGIEASGHIASEDPVQAAADGLREFPAEAIIIFAATNDSPVPSGGDVVESLRSRTKLPVIEVS
jgi:hypothetical protein